MTKRIKRIAALMIAGILLVCVSFASLAEETEEIFDNEYTEGAEAAEEASADEEVPAEEPEATEEETEEETTEETAASVEAAENDEEETAEEISEEAEEDTEEKVTEPEETETENAEEQTEEQDEEPAEETADEEVTEEETAAETEEDGETPEDENEETAEETYDEDYDELDGYVGPEDEDEYQELDDGAGYIDPEVVDQHIPEITEELIEASEHVGEETEASEEIEEEITEEEITEEETTEEETSEEETAEEETAEEETAEEETAEEETAAARAWITRQENGEADTDETVILVANYEDELNGEIRWETRNEQWDEGVWEGTGTGEKLELAITDENAENLFRFTLEDGTVSEEYRMNAAAEAAEEDPEAADEEETAEETTEEAAEEETEEPAEETTEEIAEENTDEETEPEEAATVAWITAEGNGDIVTLSANADPELTGVCTWQTWNEEGNKWQKIGYGDVVSIDTNGENAGSIYRFVMQDGTVSEEYRLSIAAEDETAEAAEEEAEAAEETAEETAEEAAEETAEEAIEETAEETADEEVTEETAEETVDDAEETVEETEEAEPFVPELNADRTVTVVLTWDDPNPGFGSTAHFAAELSGYEGLQYTFQWMQSEDDVNWVPVEGETGETMDVVVTRDNYQMYWRVDVHVTGIFVGE